MTEKEFKKEVRSLLVELKPTIGDDYRAFEEDTVPGMQVTVGASVEGDNCITGWSFQTGDNSYTGGAYHYPHWGVIGLYRRSNCEELAKEIVEQIMEGAMWAD